MIHARPAALLLLTTAACCAAPSGAEEAVKLQGSVRAHDPSTIVTEDGRHWAFTTGWGVRTKHSDDLVHWTAGPSVFSRETTPTWFRELVPGFRGSCWAPDVIRLGDRWRVYYSVSSFGKQTSAIGVASSPTLDPGAPDYGWRDDGEVVRSRTGDPFNAIDPSLLRDDDGRLWMAFGSYWDGIHLVELDPTTGGPLANAPPPQRIAGAESIEAATLIRRGDVYYLFVNHGTCCRGVESTYHVLVGRSDRVTGPYVDRDGKGLVDGGGTLLLDTEGPRIGPGHIAPLADDPTRRFGFHYYDGDDRGRSKLALGEWEWSNDGWPTATRVVLAGEDTTPRWRPGTPPSNASPTAPAAP